MDQRERCLHQAIVLASEQGTGFTMSQLARNLGMSKKTVYQLFPSKEALLTQAVDYGFRRVKESEQAILEDPELSLGEKIRRMIIVLPEEFERINWYQIQEVGEKYPAFYQRVCDHLESGWEAALQLLEEGIQAGVLVPFSLPVFRNMVIGSMEQFLTRARLEEEGISYQEALEQMMDILMAGIERREERTQ